MLYEEIVGLIGDVPSGFEPIMYIACILVLVYLLDCFYGMLRILLNHILGRR